MFICDECVALCVAIMEDEAATDGETQPTSGATTTTTKADRGCVEGRILSRRGNGLSWPPWQGPRPTT